MKRSVVAGLVLGAIVAGVTPVKAAVIGASLNANLQNGPVSISFGPGSSAAYTFSYIGSGPNDAVDAVATSGSALLGSDNLGPGFTTEVGAYQYDSTVGSGYQNFSAFPTASSISYSLAQDYVDFSFLLDGTTVYGYGEVFGSTLVQYAYDTTGSSIQTGQAFSAVPEPASFGLLSTGVVGLLAVGFRRRRAS